MPRLRRRKSAPERLAPAAASPVKTLFTRRSSLASGTALMGGFAFGGEAEPGGGGGGGLPPQSAGEARLRHCLQQPRTQRWAAAEFCYSALDRPFFMFNPLAGLLAALGLADGACLTRREWSLIRAGLGGCRPLYGRRRGHACSSPTPLQHKSRWGLTGPPPRPQASRAACRSSF
jgi:hypothetical protein